jgi:hypothetical protein
MRWFLTALFSVAVASLVASLLRAPEALPAATGAVAGLVAVVACNAAYGKKARP